MFGQDYYYVKRSRIILNKFHQKNRTSTVFSVCYNREGAINAEFMLIYVKFYAFNRYL